MCTFEINNTCVDSTISISVIVIIGVVFLIIAYVIGEFIYRKCCKNVSSVTPINPYSRNYIDKRIINNPKYFNSSDDFSSDIIIPDEDSNIIEV